MLGLNLEVNVQQCSNVQKFFSKIRACMTEYPFVHKFAFSNMFTNFIFHKDFIKILEKVLHIRGV